MKNSEVDDFRLSMRLTSTAAQKQRNSWDWKQKVLYLFPPNLEPSVELPEPLKNSERKPLFFNMRFPQDLVSADCCVLKDIVNVKKIADDFNGFCV